jgi:hypothetical protein
LDLEDEARKFKEQRAADRKRQRGNKKKGIKRRWIEVEDEVAVSGLIAAGLLAERDMRNDEAIDTALAEHLSRSFARCLVLRERARTSTGSGMLGSKRWEMQEWVLRQDHSERSPAERKAVRERRKRYRQILEEGGTNEYPTSYARRPGDNRPSKISNLPPMRTDRRRSNKWIGVGRRHQQSLRRPRFRSPPSPTSPLNASGMSFGRKSTATETHLRHRK